MTEKAEQVLTEFKKICPNGMFRLVKTLKKDSKQIEVGRCMRGSDGKLCFSEKERCKVLKDCIERIINEENAWDNNLEGDAVEGPVVCVSKEEVIEALNETKTGKVTGHSEALLALISDSGRV